MDLYKFCFDLKVLSSYLNIKLTVHSFENHFNINSKTSYVDNRIKNQICHILDRDVLTFYRIKE